MNLSEKLRHQAGKLIEAADLAEKIESASTGVDKSLELIPGIGGKNPWGDGRITEKMLMDTGNNGGIAGSGINEWTVNKK